MTRSSTAPFLRPVPWLLLTLGVLGATARVAHFGAPAHFLFDEHHFVENARNYLQHRDDWNDHPPLGKLVLAGSMALLGDTPVAWRLPSAVLGLWAVLASAWAARRWFGDAWAGALAGVLVLADGFPIAFSRAGLLDGQLAAALASAVLLASVPPAFWSAALGGALLGAAANIKYSGVAVALPLLTGLFLHEPAWRRRVALLATGAGTAAVVWFGAYAVGLGLTGEPVGPRAALADTARLLAHHAVLTDMRNPFVSGWSTWALPWRAPLLGYDETPDGVAALTMLGNLATWWSAVACGAWALGAVAWRGLAAFVVARPEAAGFLERHGRATVVLLSGVVGFVAPWALSHRDSYLYHFLPAYLGLVTLLAGAMAHLLAVRPRLATAWLAVVTAVALVYWPLWCAHPVTKAGVEARLFFSGWR